MTLCVLAVLAARQAHGEHRALARLARHRYVAAHHARELAGDGKAEPRPADGFVLAPLARNPAATVVSLGI